METGTHSKLNFYLLQALLAICSIAGTVFGYFMSGALEELKQHGEDLSTLKAYVEQLRPLMTNTIQNTKILEEQQRRLNYDEPILQNNTNQFNDIQDKYRTLLDKLNSLDNRFSIIWEEVARVRGEVENAPKKR